MERKHKSLRKSGNSSGSGGLVTALMIVAALALVAGIIVFSPIGQYLNDNVISPIFSRSKEKAEDQKIVAALSSQDDRAVKETSSPQPAERIRSTVTIDETPFYILQMGAFTERDAAEKHAAEIRRMGAGGVVFSDGPAFRVFAAAYTDESSLMKVQSQVRSDGFEATPYITDKKAVKVTLEGDAEAVSSVKEAALSINTVPKDLCAMCLLFDKGELSAGEAKKQLEQLLKDCQRSSASLAAVINDSITPVRDLLMKYQEKISTFLQENDMMDAQTASGDLKHLQLVVIIDYISFFDRK